MNKRYRAALEAVQLSDADKARISASVLKKLERRQRVKRALRRTLIPVFSAAALCLVATPVIIAMLPAGDAGYQDPPSEGDPSTAYTLHEKWRMGEYSLTFESAEKEGETLVLSAEASLSEFSFEGASALLAGEQLAMDKDRSEGASDLISGELTFYYDLTPSQWANFEDEDIALTLILEGETATFIFSYGDLEVTS